MAQKNELAVIPASEYTMLATTSAQIAEAVEANLGGDALQMYDLDVVKMPTGGLTLWTVPTLEGEDNIKSLTGIIMHWQTNRAFWPESYEDAGGSAPVCSSDDGITGHGDLNDDGTLKTYECATCPLAQFGSDIKGGRGQACKITRPLFLLRPNSVLPMVIRISRGSIKPLRQFMIRLANEGVPYYGVVVTLTLQKVKNATGLDYSQLVCKVESRLTADEIEKVKAYQEAMLPNLRRVAAEIAKEDDND